MENKLREIREFKCLTQLELSELTVKATGNEDDGISEQTIRNIELGKVKPRPRTKRLLAKALGVAPQDIFPSLAVLVPVYAA